MLLLLAVVTPARRCGRPFTAAEEQPAEAVDEEEPASRRQCVEVETLGVHRVNSRVLAHGRFGLCMKNAVAGSQRSVRKGRRQRDIPAGRHPPSRMRNLS